MKEELEDGVKDLKLMLETLINKVYVKISNLVVNVKILGQREFKIAIPSLSFFPDEADVKHKHLLLKELYCHMNGDMFCRIEELKLSIPYEGGASNMNSHIEKIYFYLFLKKAKHLFIWGL